MNDEAIKELGRRIGELETSQELTQNLVLGKLDEVVTQLNGAITDMKANNKRIDDHETRIRLREVAYDERVLPALERLRNVELKVAGSAMVGGGIVYLVTEIMKGLA